MTNRIKGTLVAIVAILLTSTSFAQVGAPATQPARNGRGRGPQGPQFISPEVKADRTIVFRILAPNAQTVRLNAGDIPGGQQQSRAFTKGENNVWDLTIGPVDPGAYRYNIGVDGVNTIDPRSPAVSESQNNVWSLVYVPGAQFMDTNSVPHGAVAAITYYSKSLERNRRMHIYTPPGYESSQEKYPVFYLLHGASDSDDSWTSVGRANFIIDNLIAEHKAKPMVVVMPAGHTTRAAFGGGRRGGGAAGGAAPRDEFSEDFVNDIMPYVQANYRVLTDREHTAMAGLSMGGGQTLNIGFAHLDKFGYLGVFSSGVFGGAGGNWESQRSQMLDDPALKPGLKVLWFSTGKDDGLMNTTKATIEALEKHGFKPEFKESPGGHTWINWRNYLDEFAPRLFQ